jgi:NAD(P)-dependent dehydrogenase (short-subunit alcohol dehydrogenase family)
MIIVNGAGSSLANEFILSHPEFEFFALSRKAKFQFPNVNSVNIQNNNELEQVLDTLHYKEMVWINFQAIKSDELLISTTTEQLRQSFEINFFKNFIAAKVLIPKMIKQKKGKFIFIDSVKAMMGDVGCASYATSKGANRPLMQSIVREYSRFNITCNTIAIGFADTPMLKGIAEDKRKSLLKDVPGKKMVDTADLNSAVKFILENDSVNGQIIDLAGGLRNLG